MATKVLLVDDNRFYRARLAALFTAAGHEVKTAADAKQAIDTARRFRPHVLVIDRMLRDDRDGFDVAEAVRAEVPNTQVVVITGYPSAAVEHRAKAIGIFALLEKPFDPQELCDSVRCAAEIASEDRR